MHGLGNDFIVIDAMEKEYFPTPDDARRLCNRRTGIGADGLMLVMPSQKADLRMRLLNSDGSTAEMCGNGIRCFAKFAYERCMVRSNPIKIETPAGIKLAELTVKGGRVTAIRVDMGEPLLDKKDIPMKGEGVCRLETIEALGREFTFSAVNTGVPHMAVFGEVTEEDILKYGPALERHPLFPAKVNVNFIKVEPDGSISVRTWERGCGRTLACGTGSCAAAVCASMAGFTGRSVKVHLALGELLIEWAENGHIYMTGPAEETFEGNININYKLVVRKDVCDALHALPQGSMLNTDRP